MGFGGEERGRGGGNGIWWGGERERGRGGNGI